MGLHFLRRMDWLGAARSLGYLRLLALLNVAMLVLLVATSRDGVDRNGFLLGSDFISFWTVGRMLGEGANVYDGAAHVAAQRAYFAPENGYTAFFYPPSFLPFCRPLGWLGYFPALATWLVVTGAAHLAAVRAWWRDAGVPAPLWLLFLGFPAVPIVATHGQTAFLVAALLGGGAWLVRSRPVLAGVLLGLATIKPQFGLLLPVALLLTREWRTIGSALVTAMVLAAATTALYGAQVWPDWLAASARAQDAMAEGAVGYAKMVSPFAALRLLGVPTGAAYAVQAVVSLGVAGLLAWAAWNKRWSPGLAALTLAGAPLVTPFVLDYDLVLLAFPLLWLTGQGLRDGFRDWEKLAILLAIAAPAFARPLAMNAGVPVMPLVLALLFAVVWRRARA
ncbi:glycosyltransferase family 87 protein [Novosphingobium kaempferiae]|uniref:glycosyltransferase family 87 protein n=1 Tax=Novosphingobium kaempferiae TaxID=2896849 RepID=UPI001E3FF333|nr:glycosyltransferase family 87 protein [Novosphingobium kaempferiae]